MSLKRLLIQYNYGYPRKLVIYYLKVGIIKTLYSKSVEKCGKKLKKHDKPLNKDEVKLYKKRRLTHKNLPNKRKA